MQHAADFHSEHFTLEALADGVFAAIATPDGAGSSNAGLLDLGGLTLVFDAFENPPAAADLRRAAIHFTGRPPDVVIVSHCHFDHWAGLQAFPGSAILATHITRQAMAAELDEILDSQGNPAPLEKDLRSTEALLAKETDARKRNYLANAVARKRHSLAALPSLVPTLPTQTFEGRMVFYGTRRTVELIETGPGHTGSDCLLHLADEKIAFVADLGFFQEQPFMASCHPAGWLDRLEELAGWQGYRFVPGHGPVGGAAEVALQARYIRELEAMIGEVVAAGGGVDEALRRILPAPFDAWQMLGGRFERNVRSAHARQAAAKSG